MDVSRQTALEIFGLKDGCSEDDINKKYRTLSKVVHPDTGGDENLFLLLTTCKDTLLKPHSTASPTTNSSNAKQTSSAPSKKTYYIDLTQLYDSYFSLDELLSQFDITNIHGTARINISPCRQRNKRESSTVTIIQPFGEFRKLSFVLFKQNIILSEEFKKHTSFNVRVDFMGETFKFKLSKKKPFHTIVYKRYLKCNSMIEFTLV